jgi:hypothetical protein
MEDPILGRSHGALALSVFLVAICLLAAVPAAATAVLDQEQPVFGTDEFTHAIGGSSEQKLAQTVTAGRRGSLVQVDLPVVCSEGAELIVKITELDATGRPSGAVLSTTRVPGAALFATDPPTFRSIVLADPPFMAVGNRFAVVLEATGASCSLRPGPIGNAYGGGSAFFDARPNPPGWLALKGFRDTPHDLPFKTWVDVPSGGRSGFCSIPTSPPHLGGPGPVTLPFPAWVPLCRCVSDRGLRDFRCGLFLPELFLLRELLPPMQGMPARIRWTAMPLVDDPMVPRILESPPQGAGFDEERIDFGSGLTALEPVTRIFELPAGKAVELDGWTVRYAWPEPPPAQKPMDPVPQR